jgi:hypothetical protein
MATETSGAGVTGQAILLHAQAQALQAFVQKHARHLTLEQAHAALRQSSISDDEDPRILARRLQQSLAQNGVKIKYTAALEAATLLLKGQSWHKSRQGSLFHTLTLWTIDPSAEEGLASWTDAAPRLVAACEEWLAHHATAKVLHIECNPKAITFMGASGADSQMLPFALLGPARTDDGNWLEGASGALEYLRRRIEETNRGFIDGLATLQLCDQRAFQRLGGPTITPADAPNSELILLRQDNPLDTDGYEIVRGDELTCFGQLEAATEGVSQTATISVDDDGGWNCGSARFAWQLATLKPREFVPGLVMQGLGPSDTSRLLRRYRAARRILDKRLPTRTVLKRLSYLGVPAETYRIDLHKLLLAMSRAGLSWEEFCGEAGEKDRELTPELPIGLTLSILARIRPDDPNIFFARPSRAELALASDDSVMRALMPRVNHVRYRIACDLAADAKEAISDAIRDLSTSILLRRGAIPMQDPLDALPDFVYSSDCEELRLKLAELGLIVYVGVMPHLMRLPDTAQLPAESWPFAFGHSLFLDIDRDSQ